MLRIRLAGNHSGYHCGSAATFEVLRRMAASAGHLVGPGKDFDLLIVNGEGSMHHDSPACMEKLRQIRRALDQGRRAMLVNSVWQSNHPEHTAIVAGCERIIVREVLSQRELAAQGVTAEVSLDLSFHAPLNPESYFEDYDGGIVFTDFWSRDFEAFARVNSKWAQRFAYLDMQTVSWSSLVRSLRTASLLVTGRHHAVYAACLARTPFLALRGNTHKIEGLIATAGIDMPIFDTFADLRQAVIDKAVPYAALKRLFDWMENHPLPILLGPKAEACLHLPARIP